MNRNPLSGISRMTGSAAAVLSVLLLLGSLLCACGKTAPAEDTLIWKTEAQRLSQLTADDFTAVNAAEWFRGGAVPLSCLLGESFREEQLAEWMDYHPELWTLPEIFRSDETMPECAAFEPRYFVRSGQLYAGMLSCFSRSYRVVDAGSGKGPSAALYVEATLLPSPWSAFGTLESMPSVFSVKESYGDLDSVLCGNPLALIMEDGGLLRACLESGGVRYEIRASGVTQAEVETLLRSICAVPRTRTSEPMEEILRLIGEDGLSEEAISGLPKIRVW